MKDLKLLKKISLRFEKANLSDKETKDLVKNLSAVAFSHQGKYLWLGTDEFITIERLTSDTKTFKEHHSFALKELIDDFDEDAGEVDIEGLDCQDGYLWVIGSHSSKRKKVGKSKDNQVKDKIEEKELKEISQEANRYLLARIPIDRAGELVKQDGSQTIACLERRGNGDLLTEALEDDEYLGDILKSNLPSKDNGLDIEGLAVKGNKILIGLRGPVLRGIALILEIEIEVETKSSHQLKLKKIENGRRYKRHFLDLDGLGIRELCWHKSGTDLLVLAGPTMDLDGALRLFCLQAPFSLQDNSLSTQDNEQLEYLGSIPYELKSDRAEGITLYSPPESAELPSILVTYDSPAKGRLIREEGKEGKLVGVLADVFSLK